MLAIISIKSDENEQFNEPVFPGKASKKNGFGKVLIYTSFSINEVSWLFTKYVRLFAFYKS
jgi:hypothetical protein